MTAAIPIVCCSILSLLKTILDARNGATYFPELGQPSSQIFTCKTKFDFSGRFAIISEQYTN
jgi:hypothetical protein